MGGEKHNAEKTEREAPADGATQHVTDTPENPTPERYPTTNRDDSITAIPEPDVDAGA